MMFGVKNVRLFVFSVIWAVEVLCGQSTTARRDYNSNNLIWTQGVITGKIKNKWSYQLDLEYRRQANPEHGNKQGDVVGDAKWNVFANPLQVAGRIFFHYQLNDKIRLSLAPFTWFGTYSYPVNDKIYFTPEWRLSPQVMLTDRFARIAVLQRYRLEYRRFGKKVEASLPSNPFGMGESYDFNNTNRHWRFRYMLRMVCPINKVKIEKNTHYVMASSEILLRFGKYVDNNQLLDQIRFQLTYGYKFHANMRFEIGYMKMLAYKLNNGYGQAPGNNVDANNILMINYTIENFTSYFQKKEVLDAPKTDKN